LSLGSFFPKKDHSRLDDFNDFYKRINLIANLGVVPNRLFAYPEEQFLHVRCQLIIR